MTSSSDQSGTSPRNNNKSSKEAQHPPIDMHGAALVDQDGNEVPITDEMIDAACECLARQEHLKGSDD